MVKHVIVGGGIAGACCAQELLTRTRDRGGGAAEEDEVLLIAPDAELNCVENLRRVSEGSRAEVFDIVRRDARNVNERLGFVQGWVSRIDVHRKLLFVDGRDDALRFDTLCVCTGARPKQPLSVERGAHHVTLLRDAESVTALRKRLAHECGVRRMRVLLVGNGGIALELACAGLAHQDVLWSVRHTHVGDSFFDADAAEFLLSVLRMRRSNAAASRGNEAGGGGGGGDPAPSKKPADVIVTDVNAGGDAEDGGIVSATDLRARRAVRETHAEDDGTQELTSFGRAIGPAWLHAVAALSRDAAAASGAGSLDIAFGTELVEMKECWHEEDDRRYLQARLSDGRSIEVDLVVAAVGVTPNTEWLVDSGVVLSEKIEEGAGAMEGRAHSREHTTTPATTSSLGGAIVVDTRMRTTCDGIFAAGDCCDAGAMEARGPAVDNEPIWWFQMRLWTQARLMGVYAAQCMMGIPDEDIAFGINMELFTHATRFCGLKVVLLGLYNGQTFGQQHERDLVSYARATDLSSLGTANGDMLDEASFVRVLLFRGRVVGAVLIGESGLEETLENLILDQLDVSNIGAALLDPSVDIEDYFD